MKIIKVNCCEQCPKTFSMCPCSKQMTADEYMTTVNQDCPLEDYVESKSCETCRHHSFGRTKDIDIREHYFCSGCYMGTNWEAKNNDKE